MNSIATTLVCFLVLAGIALAVPSSPTLTLTNAAYDIDVDATIFTYKVNIPASSDSNSDVSHIHVGPLACTGTPPSTLVAQKHVWTWNADTKTYSLFCGLSADPNSPTERFYNLILNGKVATAQVSVTLTRHTDSLAQVEKGPSCSGSIDYPTILPASRHASNQVACDVSLEPSHTDHTLFSTHTSTLSRCQDDVDVTRVWQITSSTGLTTQYTQVVHVRDSTPPTFELGQIGDDRTVTCVEGKQISAEIRANNAIARDNCDTDTILSIPCKQERTDGKCPHDYFLTNTWTAVDRCGNTVCETQTITVLDNEAPTFSSYPDDKRIECSDVLPTDLEAAALTASDNCDENLSALVPVEHTFDGACANTFTKTWTWTLKDDCQNARTHTQRIEVYDEKKPVWTPTAIPSSTVQCAPAAYTDPTAIDECSKTATAVTGPVTADTKTDQACDWRYDHVRTWTTKDGCDNTATITQTVHVWDSNAPTLAVPDGWGETSSVTVECDDLLPQEDFPMNDNCDASENVAYSKLEVPTWTCPNHAGTLVRTWTVTDTCGNTRTYTRTITVEDRTPPTIDDTHLPKNGDTFACTDVPTYDRWAVSATDVCRDSVIVLDVTTVPVVISAHEECHNYEMTFTWNVVDCSGLTASITRTVTIQDLLPPSFNMTGVPATLDADCQLPTVVEPVVTDLCDPIVSHTRNSIADGYVNNADANWPDCLANFTQTYVWTVVDDCGHTASEQQVVTVRDTDFPTFDASFPADKEVHCDADLTIVDPSASDVCDGKWSASPDVAHVSDVYNPVVPNPSCPNARVLTRTWKATDKCGHVTFKDQVITIVDDEAPTITFTPAGAPANLRVQCHLVPAPVHACAHDRCEGVDLFFTQTRTPAAPTCNFTLTREWKAVDACALETSVVQEVFVYDVDEPTFDSMPDQGDVTCVTWRDAKPMLDTTVSGTDSCGGLVTMEPTRVEPTTYCVWDTTNTVQSYIKTITDSWVITDNCRNSDTHTDTFSVTDNVLPEFSALSATVTCECGNVDACLNKPEHWPSVTDQCSTQEQIQFCHSATHLNGRTAGQCAQYTEVVQNQDAQCSGRYDILRTWTAMDCAGNTQTTTQLVHVDDTLKPVFDVATLPPATVDVACDAIPTVAPVTAQDCSDGHTVVFTTAETTPAAGTCKHSYVITRTWTATDKCGNQDVFVQTINVSDNEAPVFDHTVAADINVECKQVQAPEEVCATDQCTEVQVSFAQTRQDSGVCNSRYTLTRTWTTTDNCNAPVTMQQLVHVDDSGAPWFKDGTFPAATGPEQYCQYTAPIAPIGEDLCDSAPVVTSAPTYNFNVVPACPNNYDVHTVYTVTDACGNSITGFVDRSVRDRVAPVITVNQNVDNLELDACLPIPARLPIDAVDECNDVNSQSTAPADVESWRNQSCLYEFTVKRHWTFTDACENTVSADQIVTKKYDGSRTKWVSSLPTDTVEFFPSCVAKPAMPTLLSEDACGLALAPAVPQVGDNQIIGCPNDYTVTYTYAAEDMCGFKLAASHTRTFRDNVAPVFTEPTDDSRANQCTAEKQIDRTASDDCGDIVASPVSTKVCTDNTCVCPYDYTETTVWTATDACGNTASVDQARRYTWNKKPTIIFTDGDASTTFTSNCHNVPAARVVSASDGCGVDLTDRVTYVQTPAVLPMDQCAYTVTRTYTVKDDCNIEHSVSYTIEVRDTTNPTLHGVPADITVECGFVPDAPLVTSKDNCDVPHEVPYTQVKNGGLANCCEYELVRTWTITDKCNNPVTAVQTITVRDTFPPVIVACPDAQYECDADIPECAATASQALAAAWCGEDSTTDTCSPAASPSWAVRSGGALTSSAHALVVVRTANGLGEIKGTYTIGTDEYMIDVKLSNARARSDPNLAPIAHTLLAACYGTTEGLVDTNSWTYYRTAVGTVTVNGVATDVMLESDAQSGVGAHGRSKHMSLAANLVKKTSTDTLEPIELRVQFDISPDSSCVVPQATLDLYPDLAGCGVELTYANTTVTSPDCAANNQIRRVVTRTWTATDKSGNVATAVQTITIVDTTKPSLNLNIPSTVVTCQTYDNTWLLPSPTDACEDPPTYTKDESFAQDAKQCDHSGVWTRNYRTVDECGNVDTFSYTTELTSLVNPVIDHSSVTDAVVQCKADTHYPIPQLTATATCGANPVVLGAEVETSRKCAHQFTLARTYTTADDCKNPADPFTYTIQVRDEQQADWLSFPADEHTECNVPAVVAPTGTDNCDPNPTVQREGDVSTETTTHAVCSAAHNDRTLSTTVRRWSVKDDCNMPVYREQTIYSHDKIAPYFTSTEANMTIECDDEFPEFTPTAADDCADAPTPVTVVETKRTHISGNCPNRFSKVIGWTATDHCGNEAYKEITVTVQDTTPPVWDTLPLPTGRDVDCHNIPPPENLCASDTCSGVKLTFKQEKIGSGICNFQLKRTWTATDACGLSITHSYTLNVVDNAAPVFVEPKPAANGGEQACTEKSAYVQPTMEATDNCASPVVVPTFSFAENECTFNVTRTNKWNTQDDCGHSIEHVQTVKFYDVIAPTIDAPPSDEAYECQGAAISDTVPAMPDHALFQTHDLCDTVFTWTLPAAPTKNIVDYCVGAYDISRTWKVRDQCGNEAETSHTVVVTDTVAPVFDELAFPADTTLQCSDDYATIVKPTATDKCTGAVAPDSVTMVETYEGDNTKDCGYVIVRTWTACDPCNNCAVRAQRINIIDTISPVLGNKPAKTQNTECSALLTITPPSASDNCDNLVTITPSAPAPVRTDGACDFAYTLTYDWLAVDNCGNSVPYQHAVHVSDTQAPVWQANIPGDITVQCENAAAHIQPTLTAVDNCGIKDVVPTHTITPSACSSEYVRTEFWNVEDVCGNAAAQQSRTVTVVDTHLPTIDAAPAGVRVHCGTDVPMPVITAHDDCDGIITPIYSYTTSTDPSCSNIYNVTRKWVACDCTKHCVETTQLIQYYDDTAPAFLEHSLPETGTAHECTSPPAQPADTTVLAEAASLQICALTVPQADAGATCSFDNAHGYALYLNSLFKFNWDSSANREAVSGLNVGQLKVFTDHASISGYIVKSDDPTVRFWLHLDLGPLTSNANPNLAGCAVQAADSSQWTHRAVVDGHVHGIYGTSTAGIVLDLSSMFTVQQGIGANLVNAGTGLSNSFTWELKGQATDSIFGFSNSGSGVFMFDTTCTTSGNCIDEHATGHISRERINDVTCPDQVYDFVDTYTLEDCAGNVATEQVVYHVVDTVPPTLTVSNADWDTVSHDQECDSSNRVSTSLTQDTYSSTDNCDSTVTVTPAAPVVNTLTCPYLYDETRSYSTQDCVGHVVEHQYTIKVKDTQAPFFTMGAPIAANIDCTQNLAVNPYPHATLTASDNCDLDVNIDYAQVRTNGSCQHTYTLDRTWTATDHCGHTAVLTQKVEVADTTAPVITKPVDICLAQTDFDSFYAIPDYTSGLYAHSWGASDECGTPTITIDSCVSDQDDDFSGDCVYNEVDDVLTIRVRASWVKEEGRLFNITATAHDSCQHTDTKMSHIFIPLNNQSHTFRPNFEAFAHCQPVVKDCGSRCPCQYNDQVECMVNNDLPWSVSLDEAATEYNATDNTHKYVYTVVGDVYKSLIAGVESPELLLGRLGLEIDVTQVEIVWANHNFFLGSEPHTFLDGVNMFDIPDPRGYPLFGKNVVLTFELHVRGYHDVNFSHMARYVVSSEPTDYVTLGRNMECKYGTVKVPRGTPTTTNKISGVASIVGTTETLTTARTPIIPLASAQVDLILRTVSNGIETHHVVGSKLTTETGAYEFNGLDSSLDYSVVLSDKGGIINHYKNARLGTDSLGNPFGLINFVRSISSAFSHAFSLGLPLPVPVGSTQDLHLLIDTTQILETVEYHINGTDYRGNPRSQKYWQYQFETTGRTVESSAIMDIYAQSALDLIPGCLADATKASIATALGGANGNLVALTLNHVAGRGLFAPMRTGQEWVIQLGQHLLCSNSQTADATAAHSLVNKLMAAK